MLKKVWYFILTKCFLFYFSIILGMVFLRDEYLLIHFSIATSSLFFRTSLSGGGEVVYK